MIQITTMSNANIEIDKDSVLNLNSVAGRNTEFVQVSTATVTSYSGELAVTVTNDRFLTVSQVYLPEIEIV